MQSIPEAVVMASGRFRGRGFDSRFETFFFTPFFFFFSVSFFPLSFSFMLAPPFQCSSIFLVTEMLWPSLGKVSHTKQFDVYERPPLYISYSFLRDIASPWWLKARSAIPTTPNLLSCTPLLVCGHCMAVLTD